MLPRMMRTPPLLLSPWLADVASAVRASMSAPSWAWAGVTPASLPLLCRYRFDGQTHRIAGLVACRARRWGACADAAAIFAARAVLDGDDPASVWLLVELAPSMPSYAHLRLWAPSLGLVDPYARRARAERRRVDGVVSLRSALDGARAVAAVPGLSVRAAVRAVGAP